MDEASQVFISYRSDDTGEVASRLFEALEAHFGGRTVFLDHERLAGGTVWSAALRRTVADARVVLGETRFIAAGGLMPSNVGDIVRSLRPWAVDVSSGVEDETRGVKSHAKIDSFIRAVRAADQSA